MRTGDRVILGSEKRRATFDSVGWYDVPAYLPAVFRMDAVEASPSGERCKVRVFQGKSCTLYGVRYEDSDVITEVDG